LSLIIREYEKDLSNLRKTDNTIKNYVSSLNQFKEFIRKPLKNANNQDMEDFVWRQKQNGLKNRTINLKISRIQFFYKWYKRTSKEPLPPQLDDILEFNTLKVERFDSIIITESTIFDIVHSRMTWDKKALVVLVFCSGISPESAVSLKTTNFSELEYYGFVRYGDEKDRYFAAFPKPFYKYIKKYLGTLDKGDLLFDTTPTYLRNYLGKIGEVYIGAPLRWDELRVSAYNFMYRQGVDPFLICESTGVHLRRLISALDIESSHVASRIGKIYKKTTNKYLTEFEEDDRI